MLVINSIPRFIFLVAFLLQNYFAVSQINADSIQNILPRKKIDSAMIADYLVKMESLRTTEQEPFMVIGNWALKNAIKLDNKYLMALSNLKIGFAIISTSTDFTNATRHFTEAQTIAGNHHFPAIEAEALNGLGHIYLLNRQYAKHEEYTLRSIQICKQINLPDGVAAGYSNLATSSFRKRNEDPAMIRKAIDYMLLSIQTSESMKDSFALIPSYMSISRMYSEEKKYDSAHFYLDRSARFIKGTKRDIDYNLYYYYKGSLAHQQGNYKEAIKEYLASIDYSNKFNIPTYVITNYKAMTKTYRAMNDYKNALYYTEKFKAYEDSVLTTQNFAKAADIQNKYEREKKDKELLAKDLQLKIAAEKRGKLTIFFIASLTALGLLGVFALLLLQNIKARKKAYLLLEEKSLQIQQQAIELSKQARLIAKFQSQMNPHFVFNALHNIQGLVISNENKKATDQIQSLAQLMRKTFDNAEKDDIPLEEEISYLQKYIDFEKNSFNNKLDFDIRTGKKVENILIPPMMIQPFVENAVKHAELKKVENPYIKVLIEIENNLLSICVKDNGLGIKKDSDSLDILSHSMSVIKTRIQLMFQEKDKPVNENLFTVKTVPEVAEGTMVKFYLPLNYSY
ncbi:MAG: histidine kinase [Chitinophagaceae bacterium]|nr:histidine kinase [Chitinophagaceae bacterium]